MSAIFVGVTERNGGGTHRFLRIGYGAVVQRFREIVIISSPDIVKGETYTLCVGSFQTSIDAS